MSEERTIPKDLLVPGWLVPLKNVTQLQKLIIAVLFEVIGTSGGKIGVVDEESIGERIGLPGFIISKNIKKLETMGMLINRDANKLKVN